MQKEAVYFASDFHLGVPSYEASLERERTIIRWLNHISADCKTLYLVGDVFDFWYEYKYTVPKYFVRILGKLAEMADNGVEIHYFTGNHDLWAKDYLAKEIGLIMHFEPIEISYQGKKLFIGHGDGLGPGDHGYKFIKKVFTNPICKWLFTRIHPNFAFGMANYWSRTSRNHNTDSAEFIPEREYLWHFCNDFLKTKHIDFFIFGHRHLPVYHTFEQGSIYCNLGDWIQFFTYGKLINGTLTLEKWEK